MTIDDVLKYLEQATKEDMNRIIRGINDRRAQLSQIEAMKFRKGDKVEFNSSKTGELVKGTILKINQKTISLLSDEGTNWRVSPGMLRAVKA